MNWIQSIFSKFQAPATFTGALIDNRPPQAKADDVHFSEIVGGAAAVLWKEKYPNAVRQFPDMNQNQTNMCGAFALRKSLGVMFQQKYGVFLDFFAPDIYRRRANYPQAGMMLYDMMNIASQGVTLTQFFNSTYYTDDQADSISIESWHRDVGRVFSVSGSVMLPNDIESIASVIQTTGKAPVGLTFFTLQEYAKEAPTIVENSMTYVDPRSLHHFITMTDFTLFKGGKYIVMEDSAWFGNMKRRLLSQNWIENRMIEVAYPMNFKFSVAVGDKPSYDGMTIVSAQKCLRYEGFFPSNIDYAENVGSFTRKAIQLFQQKYNLSVTQQLDIPTVAKLREIYP